jgi:hypothetical protein
MPTARLNVFQKLVLRWERLHPYNGAQVLRLRGGIPSDLSEVWDRTLSELGLAEFGREGREYRFSQGAGGAKHQADVRGRGSSLEAALTEELNRPFAEGPSFDHPLRLIAVPAEDDSYYLALCYRHFVADSVAVRMVLRAVFERLYWSPAAAGSQAGAAALRLPGRGYWRLFGPRLLGGGQDWSLAGAMVRATRQVVQMKRVQRVETRSADRAVAYSSHPMPEGTIDRVLDYARSHGMRVNDVLLGAIGLALRAHGPTTETSRRKGLALGSIVDLRPLAEPSAGLVDTFGLFLGFTTAILGPEELTGIDEAAGSLARQHARHRSEGAAGASFVRMAAALVAHGLYPSKASISEWYRKRVPLAAGISNVNLRGEWPQRHWPGVLREYHRVSPTGPMMPLVLSATTLGTSLHLGLTRRTTLVTAEQAGAIVEHMGKTLAGL